MTPALEHVAAVAGAVAGAAAFTGDPVASALVSTGGSALAVGLAQRVANIRWAKLDRLLAYGSRYSGLDPDRLTEAVLVDEHRAEVFAQVVDAGVRTVAEEKLRLLAKVVANLADGPDEAELNTELLTVRALADIEAPHIQVLASLAGHGWPPSFDIPSNLLAGRYPLLGVLATHGLVTTEEPDWRRDGGLPKPGPPAWIRRNAGPWRVTPFGLDLLSRLNDVVDDDPPAGPEQ